MKIQIYVTEDDGTPVRTIVGQVSSINFDLPVQETTSLSDVLAKAIPTYGPERLTVEYYVSSG